MSRMTILFPLLANHQSRHQATSNMDCEPYDCIYIYGHFNLHLGIKIVVIVFNINMSHHAVTRVKCVTPVITRDFLRFQKTDFYFLFIFQSQVTRVTLTVSASSERRPQWPRQIMYSSKLSICRAQNVEPWCWKYYFYPTQHTQVICENILPYLLCYAYHSW